MEVVSGALALPVTDPSGAGEARRQVVRLVEALGFDETTAGRVAIAATEAATNLAKHSPTGGVVMARPCRRGEAVGVELIAMDRGPGMVNPAECMRDGYSTAGSPGTGLGAPDITTIQNAALKAYFPHVQAAGYVENTKSPETYLNEDQLRVRRLGGRHAERSEHRDGVFRHRRNHRLLLRRQRRDPVVEAGDENAAAVVFHRGEQRRQPLRGVHREAV